ncbi:MAG: toprim domain-containing protein, partial [Pseudomonadota bacterium]
EAARLFATDGLIAARETFAERQERARREDEAGKAKRALAARIWGSARPLAGSIAETYLRQARAIAAPLGGAMLRFDPGRGPWPPAMVAAVVNAKGDLTGAHRTFLAADGSGKAKVAIIRQSLGEIMGGFVRLARGSRLIVAEGIESAFSAWEARPPEASDCGAIAAISAGGMAGLIWAAGVRELIMAPDRDASGAGERAAQKLARRAYAAGLTVGFLRPPEGFGDWNDAARADRMKP